VARGVARAFGFLFLEIDQRQGVARLQVVGHRLDGGIDFLAGVGQSVFRNRDARQREPGVDVLGIDLHQRLINRGGFGRLAAGAQQIAFQHQAVAVLGVGDQRLVDFLLRLVDITIGQGQLRQCQVHVGVAGRGLQGALVAALLLGFSLALGRARK
jgi:hypothetical protein